ncbi:MULTISPECIES: ABC transporter ATP-binding protein [Kaistia]|uniref:ABC transporter ATP-binding protein n=1 Tax=Kaistia nematophila TaxID=2994654 RepID=A0A9X3DZX2_9HYPH|nr:ABC transporter ATP-binding protein [Kaistia nematophila]MBN9060010.1 ABC transporter ATP-binding protein [Hyphomicrobiales bacterium]MCX5567937.1 ABC transporter ATP-binding protein [Kaistia nematophila]
MIELEHVSRRFGDQIAVDDVSLSVERGTITVIVGTSGSGKSTTLRMINRLIEPSAGTILIDGKDTAAVSGEELRRGIGYVIQGNGLFPHWTVARNIATVPTLLGWDSARIARRVDELLTLFSMKPADFREKFPHQLSGGEQQRVGVARALAAEPGLLLMDEPFGALDPIIRAKAQEDLLAVQQRLGITVVLVTHDMEEAIHLGDRIAVMDKGKLLQYATPTEILARPAPGFVARLVDGVDRPFRLLSLAPVSQIVEPGTAEGPPILETATLRDALSELLWQQRDALPVTASDGSARGRISLAALIAHAGGPTGGLPASGPAASSPR